MPCNCDHLEPNEREREMRRAARLLVWTKTKMGKAVPDYAKKAAEHAYGQGGERATNELCTLFGQMHPTRLRKFFEENILDADGRDAVAWWGEHQAADAKKERASDDHLGLNANDMKKVGGKLIRR